MANSSGLGGMRVFSYSAASVLGLVIASNTLEPVLTTESERAIVNATSYLITAPIDGVVEQLNLEEGKKLSDGNELVKITNLGVSRGKLTELELAYSELEQTLLQTRTTLQNLDREKRELEGLVERTQSQLVAWLQQDLEKVTQDLHVVEAHLAQMQSTRDRQSKLRKQGLVKDADVVDSDTRLSIFKAQHAQSLAMIEQKQTQLSAARAGIFVAAQDSDLRMIKAELRATESEIRRANSEIATLEHSLKNIGEMRDIEGRRVAHLSDHAVLARGTSEVLQVTVEEGTATTAGDTLAKAVRCDELRIVAIFPERVAETLQHDSLVTIRSDNWPSGVDGRVVSVLPRSTQVEETRYVVPFPPTERRELYALIEPTSELPTRDALACGVGTWVTVGMQGGPIDELKNGLMKVSQATLATAGENLSALSEFLAAKSATLLAALSDNGSTLLAAASDSGAAVAGVTRETWDAAKLDIEQVTGAMRTKVTGLYQHVSLVTAAGFGDFFEFRPRSAAEQRRTAELSRSYRRADGHVLR